MNDQQHASFPSDTSKLCVDERVELLEKQVLILHYQQQRVVSEIESEKGTRARLNAELIAGIKELEKRVRLMERAIWSGIGIIVFVEFLFKSKILP